VTRVAIIGAGVIGCAIALQLRRAGCETINIDKNPGPGYGSTSSSCAIIRFSYSTYDSVALAYEGYHYWKNWAGFAGEAAGPDFARFVEAGHIVLKTKPDDRAETSRIYDQIGIAYENWSMDEVRRRMPILDSHSVGPPTTLEDEKFFAEPDTDLPGAIYLPQGGYVTDPQLAARNLQDAVKAAGGKFRYNEQVVEVLQQGNRAAGVALKSGETISADIVVNVGGPHSAQINRMAGVDSDMLIRTRALRREVHHLPSPRAFDYEHEGLVVSDGDAGVYFRPELGNQISVGSTDPACDEKIWVDDADEFERNITDVNWRTQTYRLARRVPDLPIPNQAKGVVDLYDVADDWTPIYDRSSLDGFYMAIGTSGHQFKNAGVIGTLMTELIGACEAGHDHDEEPVSFTGQYTNLKINLGAFSRRRSLNTASSFSVRG
jgi:sarcosine oxidase subunit beta